MKNNILILVLILLVSLNSAAYAQKQRKSKEEKAMEKEWKKKAKSLDPLEYKNMVEEHATLRNEASALNAKMMGYEEQLSAKETEVIRLKAELKQMETKIAEEQKSNVTGMGRKMNTKGIVFKVQVGAFRNKDLSKYFGNSQNFSGDVDSDGTKKYTLGYFGDYWEADNFKKYLREMGVKDAWIVAYKDGQRVEIKNVLEGAI